MKTNIVYTVGYLSSALGLAVSIQEITSIIGLISMIVSLASVLILSIFKIMDAINKAKADGIITEDEKKAIVDTVKDVVEDINETAKDIKDKTNKK